MKLLNLFLFILPIFLLTYTLPLVGQTCNTMDVTLSSQAQVDTFAMAVVPTGCTELVGNLTVIGTGGDPILNIDSLSFITSITGTLTISASTITYVSGLSGLTSVSGNVVIQNNTSLPDINGLAALTTVGGNLQIINNPTLDQCCGVVPLIKQMGVVGTTDISSNAPGCNSAADAQTSCTAAFTLSGNNNPITCGTFSVNMANGTDFGTQITGTPFSQTFSIINNEVENLILTCGMAISTNPAFTVIDLPPFVPAGQSATFTVVLNTTMEGLQQSTIQIGTNDSTASPTCNFTVQATLIPPPPIPTMDEWALIFMGLFLMTLFAATATVPAFANGISVGFPIRQLPFERQGYLMAWLQVVLTIILGFTVLIQLFTYEMTIADPIGATVCSFVLGYWWYLMKRNYS